MMAVVNQLKLVGIYFWSNKCITLITFLLVVMIYSQNSKKGLRAVYTFTVMLQTALVHWYIQNQIELWMGI